MSLLNNLKRKTMSKLIALMFIVTTMLSMFAINANARLFQDFAYSYQNVSSEKLNRTLRNAYAGDSVLLSCVDYYLNGQLTKQVSLYGYVSKAEYSNSFLKYGPVVRATKGQAIQLQNADASVTVSGSGGFEWNGFSISANYSRTEPLLTTITAQDINKTGIYQVKAFQRNRDVTISSLLTQTYEKGKWTSSSEKRTVFFKAPLSAFYQAFYQSAY